MRYAPRAIFLDLRGPAMESLGTGGAKGLRLFYLFTFLPFYLYKVQLVTPSVVAMAVRTEIAICKIVFQVFAFIIFSLMLNVEC